MSEQFPTSGTESPQKEVVWATTAEGIIKERIASIHKLAEGREEESRATSTQMEAIGSVEGGMLGRHVKHLQHTRESTDRNVQKDLKEITTLSFGLQDIMAGRAPEPAFKLAVEALIKKEADLLDKAWREEHRPDRRKDKEQLLRDRQLGAKRMEALQSLLDQIKALLPE